MTASLYWDLNVMIQCVMYLKNDSYYSIKSPKLTSTEKISYHEFLST